MGSNSNEKMISLLYQIIDSELAKPNKETDIDLIAECSDLVDELSNDTHYYTDELNIIDNKPLAKVLRK